MRHLFQSVESTSFHKNRRLFIFFALLFFLLITISLGVASTLSLLQTVGDPPNEPLTVSPVTDREEKVAATTLSSSSNAIYLPLISNPDECDLNSQEKTLADLVINDANQGRPSMTCDPILAQVARERAIDMAERSYFGHTNPDGFGPNYLVKDAGYELPSWYSNDNDGNNIESIGAGYTSANGVWAGWLGSSGHRVHLLAESSFWQSQTNYGIGYYYDANSPYRHYWVFISAPPEE
ncbi:MAG: CAP domain-containing protein [Chloroflexota bacterium]